MPPTPLTQKLGSVSCLLPDRNPHYAQQRAVSPYLVTHFVVFFANLFGDKFSMIVTHTASKNSAITSCFVIPLQGQTLLSFAPARSGLLCRCKDLTCRTEGIALEIQRDSCAVSPARIEVMESSGRILHSRILRSKSCFHRDDEPSLP